jgi:hypothetical protein
MLLERAEQFYRKALALIAMSAPSEHSSLNEVTECLQRLEPVMQQTHDIESELAPCRQRWSELGIPASPAMKAIFQRHQNLLGELISKINMLERTMGAFRENAIPKVDAFVRHQQMQRAYQQAGR